MASSPAAGDGPVDVTSAREKGTEITDPEQGSSDMKFNKPINTISRPPQDQQKQEKKEKEKEEEKKKEKKKKNTKKMRRKVDPSDPTSSSSSSSFAAGYSLLLSTTLDRRPSLIRREDGFEKRWWWRCSRCRLIVGYQLDILHFNHQHAISTGTSTNTTPLAPAATTTTTTTTTTTAAGIWADQTVKGGVYGGDTRERSAIEKPAMLPPPPPPPPPQQRPEGKVIYLLPDGLIGTEEMVQGEGRVVRRWTNCYYCYCCWCW